MYVAFDSIRGPPVYNAAYVMNALAYQVVLCVNMYIESLFATDDLIIFYYVLPKRHTHTIFFLFRIILC